MKVKLTKPLPQIGRSIPAGVILDDAPEALMEKLVKQGRAVWVETPAGEQALPPSPAPLPFTEPKPKRRRKKVGDEG